MPELISIITPAFNRAALLAQTIDSVLAQTDSDWQMIIVDDGSTDHTRECVRGYADRDERIIYLHQKNQGAAAARNRAIREASGKYLAFLDSDDCYFPGALQHLRAAVRKAPLKTKLVYGDFVIIGEDGAGRRPIVATPPQPRPQLYFQFLLSGGNPIVPSATIVEKEAVAEVGMFDATLPVAEDTALWTRLILKYDIKKVNAQIVKYRRHGTQLTKQSGLRRYCRDLVVFRFFNSLKPHELFPAADSGYRLANELDSLARAMLGRRVTTFDSALHILKIAQRKHYQPERARFIRRLEKRIPELLAEEYRSHLRIPSTVNLTPSADHAGVSAVPARARI